MGDIGLVGDLRDGRLEVRRAHEEHHVLHLLMVRVRVGVRVRVRARL